MTGYPWDSGDTLTADDLNAAVAHGIGPPGPPGATGPAGPPGAASTVPGPPGAAGSTNWQLGVVSALGPRLTLVSQTLDAVAATAGGPAGGDLTGSYPNPALTTTAVTPGVYGDATHLAQVTVDAKGRVTGAASFAFPAGGATGAAGGDLTGTYPNPALANTAVTAAIYGDATHVPQLTVDGKGRVTAAANLALAVSGAIVSATAPASPAEGMLWFDSVGGQLYVRYSGAWVIAFNIAGASVTFAQMPASVQSVPVTFPFAGKPPASGVINVPCAMALTVPASLAGTVAFAGTNTTASATFTLNKISAGSTTALGTIIKTTASTTSITLSGAGGSLAVGDVLQLATPAQDASLADVGFTIMAKRT